MHKALVLPEGGFWLEDPQKVLPPTATWVVIDPVSPTEGALMEEVEFLAHTLRTTQQRVRAVGLHVTYWPFGLAYGQEWYLDFLLCHTEEFCKIWGYAPLGESLPHISGWSPPAPWKVFAPSYRPSQVALGEINSYLAKLQTFRRKLSDYEPHESNLIKTVAGSRRYIHMNLEGFLRYEISSQEEASARKSQSNG
ncbi:MAG: hypothetical protein NZZ60_08570 [Bacteroidia bacterium]|nr:hypothetical protein [Bacteroidia bacterium]MCX7652968.1 hypothetical protein [Bacteroidia bacterium]MDW8417469.1 hypothetical protein [Bacteroidia bacterium]